jgi:hypothetical protein
MKKLIILILSITAVALLGWYAVSLMENKGKSDTELIEFSVKDTNSINKIIITDPFSNKMELTRNGEDWTDSEGGCVTQENVHFILDAFANIEFKGYLADNSRSQFIKIMSAQNTKVEIFQNGEWTKTWFIGPAAQDHFGQVMLLDSEEGGKSDNPVMMKIKGVSGIIEPRFFADKRKWMCTNIFRVPIEKISSVDVRYFDDPVLSFKVTKKGNQLDVYQQGRKLSNVDTAMIFRYLHNYKKIHFELANFELNDKEIDSMKRTMPFATLTLKETSGKTTKLRMFRINSPESQTNEFGDVVNTDMNKFWCELPNGQMVKCQYFVFNPLITGHVYFPMDLSKRKGARTKKGSQTK